MVAVSIYGASKIPYIKQIVGFLILHSRQRFSTVINVVKIREKL